MANLIQQMGHVALAVPDPEKSARDLQEIVGLDICARRDGAVFLSSNTRQYEVAYSKGPEPRVLAIGLEAADAAAVDEIFRRAKSDGLELIDDKPLHAGIEKAVRFRAPFGAIFEVHTPIARGHAFGHIGHIGPGSRPRRIEHVNVIVEDTHGASDFIVKTFGMRVSDRAGDGLLSWHRAADGYHHSIAVGPGPNKLHHYAFDLRALEDLAGIADTLTMKKRALFWGPGRHGAGGNVFTYYIDPDGCIVENSTDMYRIDQDALHEPKNWDISEGMAGLWINTWGTPPPANFFEPGMAFA